MLRCAVLVLRHVIVGEREQAGRLLKERFAPLSVETIAQIHLLDQHCQANRDIANGTLERATATG